MTLTLVQRWFDKLPQYEVDLPLLMVNGVAYTPRTALSEVQRNTALGQKLQAMIERRSVGTLASEEDTLARLRLQELLRRAPERPLFATLVLPPRTYTPGDLLREVQQGTPVGLQWISAEKMQMRYLVGLR